MSGHDPQLTPSECWSATHSGSTWIHTCPPTSCLLRNQPLDPFWTLGCHIGPIPTCLLFSNSQSLSGPIPCWHHLYNNHTIQYQLYHSLEASKHPLLSSILTSGIPTSTSVLPCTTSYFGLIDSHDHYISHPSHFHATTSWCQSLLPDLVIQFPQLIQFTTSESPELNSVPLSPSELSDSVWYHSPSSIVPPFVWLEFSVFPLDSSSSIDPLTLSSGSLFSLLVLEEPYLHLSL